jgi:hypothetical protein
MGSMLECNHCSIHDVGGSNLPCGQYDCHTSFSDDGLDCLTRFLCDLYAEYLHCSNPLVSAVWIALDY